MHNETWINPNIDFGVPWKKFLLPLRSIIGREFYQKYTKLKDSSVQDIKALIALYVMNARPELTLQFDIIGMTYDSYRSYFIIDVTSSKFEPVKAFNIAPTEYLEKCPVCNKGILDGTNSFTYIKIIDDEQKMICESCYRTDNPKEVVCHKVQ